MKRAGLMSHSKAILKELPKTCDGRYKHQRLVSYRAKECERYLEDLCRAIRVIPKPY